MLIQVIYLLYFAGVTVPPTPHPTRVSCYNFRIVVTYVKLFDVLQRLAL